MTYEQGGGGFGGLTITTKEGDPLTLKDRLTHHYTNGLSTIEITSQNASKVLSEFEKYFAENQSSSSATYKTYVIKGDNNADKINRLTAWLDTHKVQYSYPSSGKTIKGFDFSTQRIGNVSVNTNDIIISTSQPKGRFTTTLFEPQSKLNDSITYDITAWNLMYGYGLKGYAVTEKIGIGKDFSSIKVDNSTVADKPYAYLFRYKSMEDVKFMAALMKSGMKVRSAEKSFAVAGDRFDAGTLIITRRNNESVENFDSQLQTLANSMNRKIYTTPTGFVDEGKDIGSGDVKYLAAPRIAILGGEQTSSLSLEKHGTSLRDSWSIRLP